MLNPTDWSPSAERGIDPRTRHEMAPMHPPRIGMPSLESEWWWVEKGDGEVDDDVMLEGVGAGRAFAKADARGVWEEER